MGPFFIIFVVFVIILTYVLRRNSNLEREVTDRFWEKEARSNATRRKDISSLPYLTLPLDAFPIGKYTDEVLTELEVQLRQLAGEAILNLNGITNTELKLTYGAANLETLSQCDERFTKLIQLLHQYGKRLLELSHPSEAKLVLRFAAENGSDISDTYTLLADAYLTDGETDLLRTLIDTASRLTSPRRDAIVEKLNARLNA